MAKYEDYERLEVAVAPEPYPIFIGRDGLRNALLIQSLVTADQVMIVTDEVVAPLYLERLRGFFSSLQCDVLRLPPGENSKSLLHLSQIYDSLLEKAHKRNTTLIALGGGVVGDITALAASTYQRGVRLIQIPTTLLAQVDASVGGKTAINHPLGKNMIGTFYQPKAVLIDVTTLESLAEREFRAGIGEMIKYALLVGGAWFDSFCQVLDEGLTAQHAKLPYWIAQCCRVKAQYVEADEKDVGLRNLLNLGHTFGHALETITGYEHWLHGEAVAIGLYCAALLSYNLHKMDKEWLQKIERMLRCAKLPHKIPRTVDLKQLMYIMQRDKKVEKNKHSFIVMEKPGHCYLERNVTEDCLYETLFGALEGE